MVLIFTTSDIMVINLIFSFINYHIHKKPLLNNLIAQTSWLIYNQFIDIIQASEHVIKITYFYNITFLLKDLVFSLMAWKNIYEGLVKRIRSR